MVTKGSKHYSLVYHAVILYLSLWNQIEHLGERKSGLLAHGNVDKWRDVHRVSDKQKQIIFRSMFSRATSFRKNHLQLWPHSSTSYNYSSWLPFTMSATCWSQTSLLLSQSQRNHQQLRKRKWLPSGKIRMCKTSYSKHRLSPPTPLPTNCNYTICLLYIMNVYLCTVHSIIWQIK